MQNTRRYYTVVTTRDHSTHLAEHESMHMARQALLNSVADIYLDAWYTIPTRWQHLAATRLLEAMTYRSSTLNLSGRWEIERLDAYTFRIYDGSQSPCAPYTDRYITLEDRFVHEPYQRRVRR
jgi:hypothetical protein